MSLGPKQPHLSLCGHPHGGEGRQQLHSTSSERPHDSLFVLQSQGFFILVSRVVPNTEPHNPTHSNLHFGLPMFRRALLATLGSLRHRTRDCCLELVLGVARRYRIHMESSHRNHCRSRTIVPCRSQCIEQISVEKATQHPQQQKAIKGWQHPGRIVACHEWVATIDVQTSSRSQDIVFVLHYYHPRVVHTSGNTRTDD